MEIGIALLAFLTNFFTQISIPFFMFASVLPRRKYGWLCAIVCVALNLVVYLFFESIYNPAGPLTVGGWFNFSFLAVLLINLALFYGAVRVRVRNMLFYGASAYAMQNCVHNLTFVANNLLGNSFRADLWYLVTFLLMTVLYVGFYFLIVRRVRKGEVRMENRTLLLLSLVTFTITYILSMYFLPTDSSNTVARIYAAICCVFLLFLQYNVFDKGMLLAEKKTVEQLMYQEQKQYAMWRENVEIINLKCHDLKHQIAGIRHKMDSEERKAVLKEVENAIMIYETTVATGNSTLDSILTEKYLYCEKNEIHFSCIADGKKLSFMSEMDLCTLFGNALDNAIESVSQVPEKEKRIISLNLSAAGNLLTLHIDNYYRGTIRMVNNLPETTKEDKAFHGYGVRSIRAIAEKYGGQMRILPQDQIFNLDILFPLKEEG